MPAPITKTSLHNKKGTKSLKLHRHAIILILSTIQKLKQTIVEQTNDTSKFDGVKQQLENERQSVEKLQAKLQSMMGEMSRLRAESSQERLAKNANKKL